MACGRRASRCASVSAGRCVARRWLRVELGSRSPDRDVGIEAKSAAPGAADPDSAQLLGVFVDRGTAYAEESCKLARVDQRRARRMRPLKTFSDEVCQTFELVVLEANEVPGDNDTVPRVARPTARVIRTRLLIPARHTRRGTNGEQTERKRAQLRDHKPSKHGDLDLITSHVSGLGAGRSQVQILSPRLKDLAKSTLWRVRRNGEIGLGSNSLLAWV
jgi:hypothetical protein